jgi:hypothetical protein
VEEDLATLANAEGASEATFAEEMTSTALIELKQNRIRSAIVHAFIGFETASKRALEFILENRLQGLHSPKVLESISREVSTATLGKVVWQHVSDDNNHAVIDWGRIDAIHNTRNMIVHRGQKRMPPFEDVKLQVLEVRSFVMQLEAAIRRTRGRGSPQGPKESGSLPANEA